ncbi:MAG TPA: AI-2E family transporter [Gemmatimonadaceae bacterium]|nr:AI-2E family transporter [Gemmatimonadaceae bacterium]
MRHLEGLALPFIRTSAYLRAEPSTPSMRLRTLESRVFIGLVLLVTLAFLWMVRAFLMPVFWAAVLAVLFYPSYMRLVDRLGGRQGVAAFLTTVAVIFFVVIPFAFLAGALTQQAIRLYQRIASGEIDINAPVAFLERSLPTLAAFLARFGISVDQLRSFADGTVRGITQFIAGQAFNIGQNALIVSALFGLMLYMLFFFFRDGTRIVDAMVRAIPMGDERERRLLARFAEVTRATVKGTLIVAGVQGTLGGILFALVGIQAALFWGVIMGLLSLLPAVGPALVWGPAAIVLVAKGDLWGGAIVIIAGTLVIGLVDNVLRPILIGRESKMPDYMILLATLGGLSVFGLAGFVAGPVIAALFLVMWEMFAEEYAPLDSAAPAAAGGPGTAPSLVRSVSEGVAETPRTEG